MKNPFEYFRIKTRLRIVYTVITLLYLLSISQNFYHVNLMEGEINEIYNNRLVGINNLVEAKSNLYKTILLLSQTLYSDSEFDFAVQTQRVQTIVDNVEEVDKHFKVFQDIYENKELDYYTQIETFKHNYKIIFKLTKELEPLIKEENGEESKPIFFDEYVPAFNTLQETLDQLTVMSQNDAQIRYNSSLTIFHKMKLYSIIIFIAIFLFLLLSGYLLTESMLNPLKEVENTLKALNMGGLPQKVKFVSLNKIDEIKIELNNLIENLRNVATFAHEIRNGNLNAFFHSLGDEDILGNSLLEMQKSLQVAKQEEDKRRKEEESQNWKTSGIARFSDILRQTNLNINELADTIISNLVHYLDANQGGIFIQNSDDVQNKYLELISAYAFNKKKFFSRKVEFGIGLVGACAKEKKTIHLTEIPTDYIKISSGFGSTNPNSLLLVPMVIEQKLFGVIELASFNEFNNFKIDFAEHIANSIASSLESVQVNNRTSRLLEESRQKSKKLEKQEHELLQNIQQLQNIQHLVERTHKELSTLKNGLTDNFYYILCDADSGIDYINPKLLKLLDSTAENILGVRLSFYIKNIKGFSLFKMFWEDVVNGDSTFAKFEFSIPGRTYRMVAALIPFRNSHDEVISVGIYAVESQDATDFAYIENI